MGLTRSEQDAQLAELYARIPRIPDCDGRCRTSCGPVDMSDRERQRIRAAGTRITPYQKAMASPERFWCDALTGDKRCAVYKIRPMICFLPSAWIYAADGPKRVEEIYAGDRVYGPDGKLHRVLVTASRYYTGTVVNVRHTGTHVSCWSTDNHMWLAARQKDKRKTPVPEWRAAAELTAKRHHQEGDYLCFPRTFDDVPPLDAIDITAYVAGRIEGDRLLPFTSGKAVRGTIQAVPLRIPVDDEFLFMFGVFLAEGNASGQAATFTMHPDERPILERIGKYLDSLGITSQSMRIQRSAYLTISSALFGRLMSELAGTGARGKRILPSLFGRLSHAQLWSIYQAWDVGDGRKTFREQEMSTTTVSGRLAVQMGFVGLVNGMFPRTYLSSSSSRNGDCFDVHLYPSNWRDSKPGHGTKNMFDDLFQYTPVAGVDGERQYRGWQEASRHYEGPVFDLQVEDAESFVTTSGVAHNCRLWGAVEGMPCVYGCVPEGGYLTDAEAYRMIAESLRIGGGRHPDASAGEIDAAMAREGLRAEVERIRARGRAGEASRAQESIPPAFRRT